MRHITMIARSASSVSIALLMMILGMSCGSGTTESERGSEVILYSSGSSVRMELRSTKLQLTETGVLELDVIGDGRCPPDVNCVWEGEVVGRFRVGSLSEMDQIIETDGIIPGFLDGKTAPVHSLSGTPETIFELDDVRYELVATDLILNDSNELVGLEIVVTTL